MARELINSWSDYHLALDRLLALATQQILIYDEDLGNLSLDGHRLAHLQRVLAAGQAGAVRIALRNAAPLRSQYPRLLALLGKWSHLAAAQQTPEHLAHLRDNMVIVDSRHGLIRFDRDQPRSKLLIDDPDMIRPYQQRFEEIWGESSDPVNAVTLGL